MRDIPVALIAAVARNGAIGRANQLPWRLSGDLQFFKRATLGKPVVMGRKTFESIGRPLPGRENIVISSNPEWSAAGVKCAPSVEQGLELARRLALESGAAEIMVIGGGQIYRQAMPRAVRLYITHVDAEVEGDAFFPALGDCWKEISRECYPASDRDEYSYCLVQYDRLK
ncbi:dihydrofolate reductase [Microbulbifer thermotolerans]|uniref:Dihydrofolate reductase n=1 Tax=Microbulbifer thermotolerans TaxID=252514 RepID=A0AB35HUJ7_MICTH|nr:dihydrofolate reductase [Microbulbifer thermotolerans]MCX2801147.1 dihydrofolate reductase [Microbulbifer thermotolerans]MCX2831296.1 dihydrofolate reductase [Microbulbifer thermotolerans]MCX2841338.1 dihydrofolate reductase [Microbulbifer thermotolerans]